MKTTITVDETIQYLNELLSLDRPAITALVVNRVPCNEALSEHKSAQIMEQHGGFYIGLLGILNGLFDTIDGKNGAIVAVWDEDGLSRFARRDEFQ